jgi:hypothetical protein
MALNLPPIPITPISECPEWRDWLTRLAANINSTAKSSSNNTGYSAPPSNGIGVYGFKTVQQAQAIINLLNNG